jgi:hypothetical protein
MAATTGQLGLVTPTQGDLSGTWGNTVNNGITEYTNIAIAGTTTFTGDGAVTLVNTTGDASATNIASTSAQYMIVRVTGTLTTAKVITFGSSGSAPYSKLYLVDNSATGGIVTFKAYGQTGVSVAVGEKALVFYNGTDIVKVAGTTSGAAGGSNTQVQYNSSGALAGSANLTFDGTSLTLGGNPTLSAGTANGVTYLNGSKVLTSGSTLVFDGAGVLTVGSDAVATVFNSVGDVAQYVVDSNGTGSTASHQWKYGSTEAMRLNATGLGIGTSSPAEKLHISNGASTCQIRIAGQSRNMYLGQDATGAIIYSDGAVPMLFYTNAIERARISATGGFSVGTTADPSAGAIYATGNITAYYSSDIKFKENVRDIPDALSTVNAIGGKLFDWKDDYIESKGGADGYFVQKADFGVVAQDVQKVFPIAVRTREDGSLAVDYEKLGALAFAALVELTKRVEALEAK